MYKTFNKLIENFVEKDKSVFHINLSFERIFFLLFELQYNFPFLHELT